MLVGHKHKFIFTKTVKTAGTSVEGYLQNYCKPEEDRGEPEDYHPQQVSDYGIVGIRGVPTPIASKTYRWYNHKPASDIKKDIGDETWDSYFKFTSIRNPYDRVISLYYFYNRILMGRPKQSFKKDRVDFIKFVDYHRHDIAYNQDMFMIDGKFCLDDVVRYEQLHTDMNRVCDKIGVVWDPIKFPRFKIGLRPAEATVSAMYTAQPKQIVSELCRYDIETFGYKFDE
jgi:hypothetical protein